MKISDGEKKSRMQQAYREGNLYHVSSPVEGLRIQKHVFFSGDEVFAVIFKHTDYIDEKGDVERLLRATRSQAKAQGIVLLSEVDVIDACGADIVLAIKEMSNISDANEKV